MHPHAKPLGLAVGKGHRGLNWIEMPNSNLIFQIGIDISEPDLTILLVQIDTNNWAVEAQCYISRVNEQN